MSAYNKIYNKDDIFERNAIISLLNNLNNKISFDYIHTNKQVERIDIPFYLSLFGSERFLLDHFGNDVNEDKIESLYNKIPRGIVTYNSSSINTSERTASTTYVKQFRTEPDGTIKQYHTPLLSIPLKLAFDCKILLSNQRDSLILSQRLKELLYLTNKINIDYKGMRVPGIWAFPESTEITKTLEFSFSEKKEYSVSMQIELKTFQTVYNDKMGIFSGNRMQKGISQNIITDVKIHERDPEMNPILDITINK